MKRSVRDAMILTAAETIHQRGTKPTSRNVLAEMMGKEVSDFPRGMNSRDVVAFRTAMTTLGYRQKANGMWAWPEASVSLDEVLCDCSTMIPNHVMTDHLEGHGIPHTFFGEET